MTSSVYEKSKKHRPEKRSRKAKRPRIEDSDEIIRDGIERVYDDTWADPPDNDVCVSVIASKTIYINVIAG